MGEGAGVLSQPQQVALASWQDAGTGTNADASTAPAHPAYGQGAAHQPWQATRVLQQALRNPHLMEGEVLLMGCVTPSTATPLAPHMGT